MFRLWYRQIMAKETRYCFATALKSIADEYEMTVGQFIDYVAPKGTRIYRFRDHVFKKPFTPYYDAYKGHLFTIDQKTPHPQDPNGHVWLECVSSPSVKVDGFIDIGDILPV